MHISPEELAVLKAKYQEAEMYRLGKGRRVDLAKAARLYREVVESELKSTNLRFDEGLNYAPGAEPVRWFRRLADAGNVDAQFLLGRAYSRGRTMPKDPVEALKWFVKAAVQGDADAQCEVASAYQLGYGVRHSNLEARKWWEKAAAQGHEDAKFMLEKMHSRGE